MARPKKIRRCQGRFSGLAFKPTGSPMGELERIELGRDELEALKLCDLEGFTQHQAGQKMGVSRGTVQRLVSSARRKVARALVEGAALVLEEYDLKD